MVLAQQIRDQSREHSIQVLPDARKDISDGLLLDFYYRGPLLPRRASQQRERYLRDNVYYHDYNWMVQGAFAGIMKKVASTPWEVKGPGQLSSAQEKILKQAAALMGFELGGEQRTDIEYYQQILRQADFGAGWTSFVEQGVDFLRQDRGWVWEAIFPGDPNTEPTGPLMGIAHMDSLKCRPTGDPDFPMLYFDKGGKQHLLYTRRVRQLVDMPDGDERKPGYGLCALSRAVSIANREILAGRYIEARLDDKPPPGFMQMQGITMHERRAAFAEYKKEQNFDERPEWGRIIFFHGMDKDTPVQITSVPFSEAPEKFDFKVYTEIDVHSFALAIGVDVQELWELTTGNIGSQGQSEILHVKSQGKTIGSLMTAIERNINDLLPDEYEFTFKYRDAQEDQQNAQIANTWVTTISGASDLSPDEKRQAYANTVEQIGDVITDANGQIRRVNDLGLQPQERIADDTSVLSTIGGGHPGLPGDGQQTLLPGVRNHVEADTGLDTGAVDLSRRRRHVGGGVDRTKDIAATRLEFEVAFADAIQAAKDDDVSRRRFGIIARALISRLGRQAYKDGLTDGGIEDDLSDDDLATINALIAEQSGYVTDFADNLFGGSDPNPDSKAGMWFNKSVMPFYQEGLASADKNSLYEWVYGDTEHCKDCLRLNGQKHRLKGWLNSGWMPQGDILACGGFKCACKLIKTSGRASGRY